MRTLILWAIAVSCIAQMPPPPGGGGGTNTNTVVVTELPWIPPVDGAIHTTATNAIAWWNFDNRVFTVEWRQELTDGSWTVLGEGYKGYEHNAPTGFYRVLKTDDIVFPVWNSGTTNLVWWASGPIPVECVNTNIPPEWGEGYIIVRDPVPCVIDVYSSGGQHMQVSIVE